ncbi:hypothetical protein SCA6_015374 [Theobroma cacao]
MANVEHEIAPLGENNNRPKDLDSNISEKSVGLRDECCIYKVSRRIRAANDEAYTPQLISIGPVHHGNKNLAPMERQKERYYEKFFERTSEETKKKFESYMEKEVQRIYRCYDIQFVFELEAPKFKKIILRDAIFIVVLFLVKVAEHIIDEDDFLIRRLLLTVELPTDLMLLENQLPFFVLEDLYYLAFGNTDRPFFLGLARYFFSVCHYLSFKEKKVAHFTDLIRYHVVENCPSISYPGLQNTKNATMLHEAGVKFRGKYSFRSVKFEKGVLEFPSICVTYETDITFRNLIAFEQYHYPNDAHFASYVQLLDSLIDTEEDVDILVKEGIIENKLSSSAALANMINNVAVGIVNTSFVYGDIGWNLNNYYANSWNRRMATLKHVYFNDLWRGTATVAAFIVVLLTLTQTLLAILDRAMPTK